VGVGSGVGDWKAGMVRGLVGKNNQTSKINTRTKKREKTGT
jgi:hypothetical protein